MIEHTLPAVASAFEPLLLSGDFLYYAVVFFVIALIMGVAGFRGLAGLTMEIARLFVVIFLVLAVIAILL